MKFSVAILCYNYGRYLGGAIASALDQHGIAPADREVLVIDDGSTDETPEVCAAFGDRIRALRFANEGFGASLTRAIANARGDYVALLDADDVFLPGKLASLGQVLGPNIRYADHRQLFMDAEGRQLEGVRAGGNTSTICVHRESALPLLPIENEVALQVILKSGCGRRLPEPLTLYRLHGNSMTDRDVPGRQNDYLAGIHRRLALRIQALEPVPAWMPSRDFARALARDYESVAYYNDLEAALERGQRGQAVRACLRMIGATAGSASGYGLLHARMVAKTILMRPSFPKRG